MGSFLSKYKLPLAAGFIMVVVLPIAILLAQTSQTAFIPRAAVDKTPQSKISLSGPQRVAPDQPFSVDIVVDTSKDPEFYLSGIDALIEYDPESLSVTQITDKLTPPTGLTLTTQTIDPKQVILRATATGVQTASQPTEFTLASLTITPKKLGKNKLNFVYTKPSATDDTNLVGYKKDKPVGDQVARERLLSEPPVYNLNVAPIQPSPSPSVPPIVCTQVYSPVCCNGKTYSNQCEADAAGATNCRPGECTDKSPVNWKTDSVILKADNFYITAHGEKFTAKNAKVSLNSDPPGGSEPNYTTLEAIWQERGQEMRLFIYFRKDNSNWWAYEVRSYGGPEPGKWVYYHDANNPEGEIFQHSLGQTVIRSLVHLTPTGESQNLSPTDYNVHFENLKLQAFTNPTPQPSCFPRPTCLDEKPVTCQVEPLPPGSAYCPPSPKPSSTPTPTPTPKSASLEVQLSMLERTNQAITGTLYGFETDQVQGVTIAQGFGNISSDVSRTIPPAPTQTIATFTTDPTGRAMIDIPAKFQGKRMNLYVRTISHLVRQSADNPVLLPAPIPPCIPGKPCPLRPTVIQRVTFSNLIPGNIYIAPNQTEQDNVINSFDAAELIKHLGKTTPSADLNGDSTVNTRDLQILLGNLGKTGDPLPGQPTPNAPPNKSTTCTSDSQCPTNYICLKELAANNQESPIGVCVSAPRPTIEPITYQECIKLPGSRIQETYPPICVTADGRKATQKITKIKPGLCPDVINKVCGSDGQTYNNECEAEKRGLNWTRGTCSQ